MEARRGKARPSRAEPARPHHRGEASARFSAFGPGPPGAAETAWRPIRASSQCQCSPWRATATAGSPRRSAKPSATAGEPGPSSSVISAKRELERWEPVGHLGGRRDARVASGTGHLPRRPQLARAMEALASTAWLPAGGSQGRPPSRPCLTRDCHCRTGPSGLARRPRVAMESSVRPTLWDTWGHDLRVVEMGSARTPTPLPWRWCRGSGHR